MHEMVQPMNYALPHLQPPKRVRGKAAEQDSTGDPGQPNRRRRCRVSDNEVEQIRRARLAGELPMQPAMFMPPVLAQTLAMTIPAGSFSGGSDSESRNVQPY